MKTVNLKKLELTMNELIILLNFANSEAFNFLPDKPPAIFINNTRLDFQKDTIQFTFEVKP